MGVIYSGPESNEVSIVYDSIKILIKQAQGGCKHSVTRLVVSSFLLPLYKEVFDRDILGRVSTVRGRGKWLSAG